MPEKLDDQQEIKVSVCVATYNQEKYIAQCLQSLISQKTNFKFEIIIGEDFSTDQTRKIANDIYERNSNLIVKNFHPENVGAVKNIISTYKIAKGKYICHMDGDDYALPGKLQAQYDALEQNPDCVICSHDMIIVDSKGKKIRDSFRAHKKGKNTITDLLETLPFFAHSSKMFSNKGYGDLWETLDQQAIDIEIHVAQAKYGDIYHIASPLGAYRAFTGVSTQANEVNPILERGSDRIFKKILAEDTTNRERILYFYAKQKYRYAYQSALLGDKDGTKRLIAESAKIKKTSAGQIFFYILSKTPRVLVYLCKKRATLRGYKF